MSAPSRRQDAEARLQEAARVAIAREDRAESPRGEWRDRLWYPAADERQACCANITPTEVNRQALESHCRTRAHVAQLFDVPLLELRRAVKRAREAGDQPSRQGQRFRLLSSPGGPAETLYEVSRGVHGAALRELGDEARRFAGILPRLISAAETGEGVPESLESATASIDRLRLTLEYCRQVEATYDAARAVRETVAALLDQRKQSA